MNDVWTHSNRSPYHKVMHTYSVMSKVLHEQDMKEQPSVYSHYTVESALSVIILLPISGVA